MTLSEHSLLSYTNTNNIFSEKLADGSINFSYNSDYNIAPEYYVKWPKFHSIILDEKNQQVASLLFQFKDMPNFESILKVCSLFEAVCDYREIGKIPNQALIRISYNSIPVIAYFSNIYGDFSNEAGLLLDHILVYMVEDMLDKTIPTWKLDISLNIRYEYNNAINQNIIHYSNAIVLYNNQSFEICLPPLTKKLSIEAEKIQFEKEKIEYVAEILAQIKVISSPKIIKEMAYYKKFEIIENFFNTTDKCNNYLYKRNADVKSYIEEIQPNLEHQLLKLFTPSAIKQIGNALISDTSLKNAKSGNTLVGASTDLIVNSVQAAKKYPVVGIIFTTLTLAKVLVSSTDLLKRNGLINNSDELEINFSELSKSFICKVTICSLDNFIKLNPASRKILVDFYTKYIYASITKDPHQYPSEAYLASNLLDKLSNRSYVDKLDLKKELALTIENNDGSVISISDYITGYNQTSCYSDVLHDLMGQTTNSSSEET